MPGTLGSHKRVFDPPGIELQTVVSNYVDTRNFTWVLIEYSFTPLHCVDICHCN